MTTERRLVVGLVVAEILALACYGITWSIGYEIIVINFWDEVERTITWPTVALAVLGSALTVMWAALFAYQTPVGRAVFVTFVAAGMAVFFFFVWACTADTASRWWLVLVHVAETLTVAASVWHLLGHTRPGPTREESAEPVMAQ